MSWFEIRMKLMNGHKLMFVSENKKTYVTVKRTNIFWYDVTQKFTDTGASYSETIPYDELHCVLEFLKFNKLNFKLLEMR